MSGGSLRVYFLSQSVARAVVSWLATVKGEEEVEGCCLLRSVEEAVVKVAVVVVVVVWRR